MYIFVVDTAAIVIEVRYKTYNRIPILVNMVCWCIVPRADRSHIEKMPKMMRRTKVLCKHFFFVFEEKGRLFSMEIRTKEPKKILMVIFWKKHGYSPLLFISLLWTAFVSWLAKFLGRYDGKQSGKDELISSFAHQISMKPCECSW